jgi:hypothetical protein
MKMYRTSGRGNMNFCCFGPNLRAGCPTHLAFASCWEVRLSWQAVTWVLEQSESVLGVRLVLLSIASHSNREGKSAWPSVDTICLEARLSRREVQYCLRKAEQSGELRTIPQKGRPNSYELPLVIKWLGAQNLRMSKLHTPSTVAHPNAQGGVQSSAPEPFLQPSKEREEPNFLSNLSEPSKNLSADLQSSKSRLLIRSLGRKIKPQPTKSWEQQKAELRQKGFL